MIEGRADVGCLYVRMGSVDVSCWCVVRISGCGLHDMVYHHTNQ